MAGFPRHHPAPAQAHDHAGAASESHGPGANLRSDLHPDSGRSGFRHGNGQPVHLPHSIPLFQFRLCRGDVIHGPGRDYDLRPLAAASDASEDHPMKFAWRYALASIALIGALAPIYWLITISLKKEIDQFAYPPLWWNFAPTFEHYRDALLVRS